MLFSKDCHDISRCRFYEYKRAGRGHRFEGLTGRTYGQTGNRVSAEPNDPERRRRNNGMQNNGSL